MNLFDEFGLLPSSANWIEVRRIRPDESAQHSACPTALARATGPAQARRAGASRLLLEHVTVPVTVVVTLRQSRSYQLEAAEHLFKRAPRICVPGLDDRTVTIMIMSTSLSLVLVPLN